MPRKPKAPEKVKLSIPVNGRVITVTLIPPSGKKASWYAYWAGLTYSLSTGQSDLKEATKSVHDMLQNGGRKNILSDVILSDDEFDRIQEKHYSKKTDPVAQKRSAKSLMACMEAINAFREIANVKPICTATPEDCERFQATALSLPTDWRRSYSIKSIKNGNSKNVAEFISPNTVLKWSVALKAAFERVNRNAGKKCVRSVVSYEKLLTENPWKQFTWIEGREKAKRHFNSEELISLIEFLEEKYPTMTFVPAFIKVALWSWARKEEISSLRWDNMREVGREFHFESIGKWGVKKWFRLPSNLIREIKLLKTDSPFIFGIYPQQLKSFHIKNGNQSAANRIRTEFIPDNLGDWIYRQIKKWSDEFCEDSAYLHIFRKTGLQFARKGEDLNQLVASDARLTATVMTSSYTSEDAEELRNKSNRTFQRIAKSLPVDVAVRYGYEEKMTDRLIEQLDSARSMEDWNKVFELADHLSKLN